MPGQNVGPDETANAGESVRWRKQELPTQVFGGKPLLADWAGERHMRERFGIELAKQMMHYGIADQHDFYYVLFLAGGDVVDHGSEKIPNQYGKVTAALREANPAHHVGALDGLGIQARAQAKQFAARQVSS